MALMDTGLAKRTVCQPVAVSSVNVAVARRAPLLLQRLPVCTPVFRLLL
jgi:hypothetical protein